MPSRMEREGREIFRRIHSHDKSYGGFFTLCAAGVGKGKTALMLSTAKFNLVNFPKEKNFWSDCFDTPIQAWKLSKDVCQIWVEDLYKEKIVFRNRDKNLTIISHEDMGVRYFTDFKNLYESALPDKINVVFFYDRHRWMEYIAFLRSTGDFTSVFLDEISEIATALGPGLYQRNQRFSETCKDIRKCMMNVWATAQNFSQVHWGVLSSVQIKIFGPGARKDKHCRIHQKAIDNLKEDRKNGNEFYIAEGGVFGLFRLRDIFEPLEGCNIEAHRLT